LFSQNKVIVHRLNGTRLTPEKPVFMFSSLGYGVLLCLIVGNICGGIVARRSFGGELNVQSGYCVLGLGVVVSGIMGMVYVKKDTRRHRKWMLRALVASKAFAAFTHNDYRYGGDFRGHDHRALDHTISSRYNHEDRHLLFCTSKLFPRPRKL
jgi:hypothetical protein